MQNELARAVASLEAAEAANAQQAERSRQLCAEIAVLKGSSKGGAKAPCAGWQMEGLEELCLPPGGELRGEQQERAGGPGSGGGEGSEAGLRPTDGRAREFNFSEVEEVWSPGTGSGGAQGRAGGPGSGGAQGRAGPGEGGGRMQPAAEGGSEAGAADKGMQLSDREALEVREGPGQKKGTEASEPAAGTG